MARLYFESVQLGQSFVTAGNDKLLIHSMIEEGTVRTKWETGRADARKSADRFPRAVSKRESQKTDLPGTFAHHRCILPVGVSDRNPAYRCRIGVSGASGETFGISILSPRGKASLALETCRQEALIQARMPRNLYSLVISGYRFAAHAAFTAPSYQKSTGGTKNRFRIMWPPWSKRFRTCCRHSKP